MDRILGTKLVEHNFVIHVSLETLDGEELVEPKPILLGRWVGGLCAEAYEVDTDRGVMVEENVYVNDVHVFPCVRSLMIDSDMVVRNHADHVGAWVHGPEDEQGIKQSDKRIQQIWKRLEYEVTEWLQALSDDLDIEEEFGE